VNATVNKGQLGRLVSVHPTAPAFIQRAAIVAILAFVFFLVMLVAFLLRQQIGYLILAAAFLVLNLFTLIGFVVQRKNLVSVFDNGFRYRKLSARWPEIVSVDDLESGLNIVKTDGSVIKIPRSIDDLGRLNSHIREKTHL
jgi:hypothetical protein